MRTIYIFIILSMMCVSLGCKGNKGAEQTSDTDADSLLILAEGVTEPEEAAATELSGISLIDLVGRWSMIKPYEYPEYDWLEPHIIIREDHTITASFYGHFEGNLIQVGQFDFIITNFILFSEGFEEPQTRDGLLHFDAKTKLLRFSRWLDHGEQYAEDFFERDTK